ncbi:hypothetical protein Cgig2_000100 [Carnegiea gigantea]|uniref:Protein DETOXIFICATION n=1 Tax=Carnegiea gigantea TaxID=171969 RepID=A0A9Q1L178_9CARY|nr:hypothetical protein Cgig2_000100 [Carnegiea gigantea]
MEAAEEIKPDIEAPLLSERKNHNNSNVDDDDDSSKEIRTSPFKIDEIWEEMKQQLKLAGPLVTYNLLVFSLQVVSVMFVGHLGELPLSAASMATSFASVTGFSLLRGMANALDTFCGQSYGAKQYSLLGIQTQRAMLVLVLISIPLALVWANTAQILAFAGQDPEISAEAGVYALYMIPSLFAFGLLQCLLMFLQAQNNVFPMLPIAAFSTLLHILVCWLLVFKLGFRHKGAAISNCISYWMIVTLLGLYVRFSTSCKETWTGFSNKALDIGAIFKFLRLALPSSVMTCLEIWSFEMMVLLAGLLPNPKLEASVLSISLNTATTLFMIPLGLGGATSTRVANELGAGRPYVARLAVLVSMLMVNIEGISAALALILGHNFWGYCYGNKQEVVKYVGQVLLLVAPSHFVDGMQSVLSGIVDGDYNGNICPSVVSANHNVTHRLGKRS